MPDNQNRPRVALITCEWLPDMFEDDKLLVRALERLGIEPVPAVWSRSDIDWMAFDALVIRSPWDYFERLAPFRRWLDARIASGVTMCNAPEILAWNFDKSYLQDLAKHGVALVPTVTIGKGEQADIAALARAQGWDEIVVKPTISGGAYRTHRLCLDELPRYAADIAETLQDRGILVQPFLPEILSDGELSLLFFDGEFSHAVRKRAAGGDYRVQLQFGGTNEDVAISDEVMAQARRCLEHAPGATVYARVDGVLHDGKFLLMELEVFEPLMFLARHPEAAQRFARAIARRLPPSARADAAANTYLKRG